MANCFGQLLYNKQDIEKISGLSPEMRALWIKTKCDQLEIAFPPKKRGLKPIDRGKIDPIALDTLTKVESVLSPYKNIICSISGGSDSDVVLDILARGTSRFDEIRFVYFDTGVEYQATKTHLDELEKKYGMKIVRYKAIKSIPTCAREYGQPFLSKYVSHMLNALQKYGFTWEDRPYEDLAREYPRCSSYLKWWCNVYSPLYSISRNKWLKEFIVANPPTFPISDKCCEYAKKKVADKCRIEYSGDLMIIGVRKAEGGVRSMTYKSCFDSHTKQGIAQFRPIFWFSNEDKARYDAACDINHSDCYTVYGLKRTGCVGCPFNPRLTEEIEVIREFEPNLVEVTGRIWKDSYEYTEKYRAFAQMMNEREKNGKI